jgi:Icc protein
MQQVFSTAKVSCQKQLILGGWQVINLNSQVVGKPGGRVAEQELLFLEHCLRDYPEHHAMIAVHHHCLKTHSSWMDTMIIENSEELFAVLKKFPQVKLITTGHIHQVLDEMWGDVRVLGAPSTCFQFEPGSDRFIVNDTAPGYRLIKLAADGSVNSEVVRLPGHLAELQSNGNNY